MKFSLDLKQRIRKRYEQIKEIRDAPHAVAGGVAIGMFWGCTPLTGLKTLFSVLMAWLFRCSKLSAVLTVAFHDVLFPIWPVILRWEYVLGYWILSHPHHFPQKINFGKFRWENLTHLKTLELLWPTCVGSLLFGIPLALVSYWVVERSLERYERKRHKHLTPPA